MYVTKIGHIHLKVSDLNKAIDFYTKFLNLKLVERVDDEYAFLTNNKYHHEIALKNIGRSAKKPTDNTIGLFHFAFEVPNKKSLAEAYRKLTRFRIEVGTVDHLISWAIYFHDPDGNGIELYCDTRKETGIKLWQGKNLPLPEKKLLAA